MYNIIPKITRIEGDISLGDSSKPTCCSKIHINYFFLTSLLAISPGVGQLVMSLKSLDWVVRGKSHRNNIKKKKQRKKRRKQITTPNITVRTATINIGHKMAQAHVKKKNKIKYSCI